MVKKTFYSFTFRGDVNKLDILGLTALHHAAQHGHLNCVSFLVNFGANFWMLDNDQHTCLDIAALENREDIVKFLDDAQSMQHRKNPKIVQQLKEKALRESEKNAKLYEKLQDKASKDMARSRRKIEREDAQRNNDFKTPGKESFVKKLTLRMKGNTTKLKVAKASNGVSAPFSDLAGTSRRVGQKNSGEGTSVYDFRVSDVDDSGKRTIKSVGGKGTIVRNDAQVLYMIDTEKDNEESGTRPALTNVFPGAKWKSKSESNLIDSGIDSFESSNHDDEDADAPGIFSRPNFGNISFLNRFDNMPNVNHIGEPQLDDLDIVVLENGTAGDEAARRISSGTDSIGTSGSLSERLQELPWQADDVETLDDDEEENEYTPVVMFLEGCGLTHYIQHFTSGDVDMDALMRLTNQDFNDMGLPIGPRRKLMDAIQRRRIVLSEPAQMYDTQL